jgi:protein-S-isoprenylcysteine O-methyltransferase Ste14
LPALLLPLAFLVARIEVEERTLRETLPGYGDYTRRVRHRLVPFVW